MTIAIGTGISTKLNSFSAGKEAALNAYYQIGKNEPGIIITFISTIFDQEEVIKGIHSIIKDTPLIGCSTMGCISIYGSHRDSVSVFIINTGSIEFSCGIGRDITKSPRLAGHKAAKQASDLARKPKQVYMMFSDSLSGNSADILRGAQEAIGTSFPIIGGGACNKSYVEKTYQYMDNEIYTDSVAGLLISGDIGMSMGQASGWQPIGKPHKATKAKSNIINEIDKKIAVEIYEEYFEKSFEEIKNEGICKLGISYPIGIRIPGKDTGYLIRVPLKAEEGGSIVLNADLQEEEDISLMIGDKDIVLESARNAALEAMSGIKNAKIKFAVIFSDIARLGLLRRDAGKEIDIIKDVIGKNTPIMGCYTFGEYTSFNANRSIGHYCFNNQSISIALFSE